VWVGLLSYAREFLQWLGIHAQALQTLGVLAGVVVTLAGVIVALYYARLTRNLARSTRNQARTTREMFEAGHRPYLQPIFVFEELRYYDPENFDLHFSLHNHGAVPATLAGWYMEITFNEVKIWTTPTSDRGVAVFPGERTAPLLNERLSGASMPQQQPPGKLQLDLFVEYRRLDDESPPYTTRATVVATGTRTHWEMVTKAR
jgi:hypothetical protein